MNRSYFAALDGFRALAIVLVLLHHISFRAFPGGHIGVDLFFVLSGFLITSVILREYNVSGTIDFVSFYIRRSLRLAPALFLVALIVGIWLFFFGGPAAHEALSFLAALTYTMDFVRSFGHVADLSTMGATWSLAIEEQFYLVWPALVLILLKFRARWQLISLFGLIALVNILRVALYTGGAQQSRIYFCIDTRADQLLIGCALALWLNTSPSIRLTALIRSTWPLVVVALAAVVRFDILKQRVEWFEFSIVGALAAIMILELTQAPQGIFAKTFASPPMVFIGRISYGIYLWHYPILLLARYYTPSKFAVAPAILGSIAIAALSYQFFELPILRLKQRFEPKGVAAIPAESKAGETSFDGDASSVKTA